MGDWSISITLSTWSRPSTASWSPGSSWAPCSSAASARRRTSWSRDDFPEPETPVTAVNTPTGNETSIAFRLWWRAPRTTSAPRGSRRVSGTGIRRSPRR